MKHWEAPGKTDEWYTPKYIFDALDTTFDMDVAAPADRTHCHVQAAHFITKDSLQSPWQGFIWMNPPFGGKNELLPWLERFFKHGNGICLTPDRTSASWWHYAMQRCDAALFLYSRVKFIRPDGTQGSNPSNGITLFGVGESGVKSLQNAEKNGLGIIAVKSLLTAF